MKQFVLNIIPVPNKTIPFFLREMGKYYWNEKMFLKYYNYSCRKCVRYSLVRTFNFFNPEELAIEAVNQNNIKILEYLIRKGININTVRNNYILLWAVNNGRTEIIKKYAEKPYDDNLFLVSLSKGRLDIVKFLIENGVSPNMNFWYSENPLSVVAEKGYFEIAEYLIQKGAVVSTGAFTTACEYGFLNIIKLFIEKGYQIGQNNNCLNLACSNGHFEIVKYLVKIGVYTDDCISFASMNSHLHIVEYLVQFELKERENT